MTYQQAKDAIVDLSARYNQMKGRTPAEVSEAPQPQTNGHQDVLTLEAVQKRAVTTGVAKSRKDWQFFNAETLGAFVPDEKLKDEQARLVLLNDEITARVAKAGK